MKLAALIVTALFIFSLTIEARTVTAYRTIIAATDTEEGAMLLKTEGTDVVPYRGSYVVVSGWFDDFEAALPEGNNEIWNQRWRHVLPVEIPAETMKAKGLRVAELKTEKALRSMGELPVRLNNRGQLRSRMVSAVDFVKNTEMQPGAKTADLVAALTPQVEAMIQLAERSPDPAEAEEAQLWLAKTYYLEGLMLIESADADVRRLAKRLRKYWDELLTFLEDPTVPATNNHAEREIRPAVIMRKVMQGNRSDKGAQTQSVLMSLLRTLKRRDLPVVDSVVNALQSISSGHALPAFPGQSSSEG